MKESKAYLNVLNHRINAKLNLGMLLKRLQISEIAAPASYSEPFGIDGAEQHPNVVVY